MGWLELFYDLVYVATIIKLGDTLSRNVDVLGAIGYAGMFIPVWFTWTGFTFYSNRFVVDDALHRLLVFVQMFGIGAMAVCIDGVFQGHTRDFALVYAGVRFVLALLYLRTWLQAEEGRLMTRRFAIGFFAGGMLWLLSAFVPWPWVFLLWAIAMATDFSVALSRPTRELAGRFPPDARHMAERYGLLTIIVLGETFVKLLGAVTMTDGQHMVMGGLGALCLLITFSLWWIYFDDVAGSRIKRTRMAPFIWVYAHLPLTLAITALGVSIKKAVFFEPMGTAPEGYRWLMCGSLGLTLITIALLDAVTERRQAELGDRARVNVRFGAGVFVVLLAPTGAFLPAWLFLAMVAGLCVLQVVFDLWSAPLLHEVHGAEAEHSVFPPIHAEAKAKTAADAAALPARRPDPSQAVRKGTPNELRRDLYFHFMQASWTQVMSILVTIFLLLNVFFAALYLLSPSDVTGLATGTFMDAFAFSVQTMTTIGYGAMSPTGTYAHVLVTAEAAVGLLGAAVATGLVFAKASRPSASVLFSKVAVIQPLHGARTLMFRVGNARGNDIVEASIGVAALIDETSPEGHRMRKLHDLRLTRSRTPLFALTWSVMHTIDENSPLFGVTPENLEQRLASIVVTLTGHDSTYAQTIHARTIYQTADLRFDHQFVDVISTLADGRLMVDYTLFHDTRPYEASQGKA